MNSATQAEQARILADIREALCAGDKPLSEFPALIRGMREALIRISEMDKRVKEKIPVPGVPRAHTFITEPGEYATIARNALSGTMALEKDAMRKECVRLMQWAFTEIRFICGHVNPTYFHKTETGLTSGEQAWIWALSEFSHNLPHLIEYDFSRPYFFFQMDEFKILMALYARHHEEIIGRHAEGWTKERIYSLLFPQRFINSSLSETGQSTGKDDA